MRCKSLYLISEMIDIYGSVEIRFAEISSPPCPFTVRNESGNHPITRSIVNGHLMSSRAPLMESQPQVI